jgi:predicted esterase
MPMDRRITLVAVVVFALLSAAASAPRGEGAPSAGDIRKLHRQLVDALAEGRLEEATDIGTELVRLDPGSPAHRYNLACVRSRAGDGAGAVGWLRTAAATGFRRPYRLRRDPDLVSARSDPGFAEVAAAVDTNLDRYREVLRRHMEDDPPLVIEPRERGAADDPAPLVIALHGFGGRPSGYPAMWGPAARAQGAFVACPHGMGTIDSGFFWRDEDEAEVIVEVTLEWVRARHAIDPARVVLTGFSQGGGMALVVGFSRPELFRGVIPMAHGFEPVLDAPPPARAGAPRFFLMVGAFDDHVDDVRAAAHALEAAGYVTSVRVYPKAGHTYPRFRDHELGKALGWVLDGS